MTLTPIEHAAKLEYEYYGSTLTQNTALKYALLISVLAIGMLSFALQKTARAAASVRPIIIRINEVGRADALAYSDFTYKPQAPEIRYFLTRFVTGYYSRNHATITDRYPESLALVDRGLFNQIDAVDRKTQWVSKFLASNSDDETVSVSNVVIEDLKTEPYRARVEFSKAFTNTNGTETKHERWAVEILFRINPEVSNDQVTRNPLGLAISNLQTSQAFTN